MREKTTGRTERAGQDRRRSGAGRRAVAAGALALAFGMTGGAATAVAHGPHGLEVSDRFAPPGASVPSDALTYDQHAVPAGAGITVTQRTDHSGMTIRVHVRGVQADRTFGVHVHTKPCGADPDASGPHYQHRVDPHQPSTDPAYANPYNEVWLDFTTDGHGHGHAEARQDWRFRPGGARSVVLHEHGTATGHGEAGTAGDRLACFTVPFTPTR